MEDLTADVLGESESEGGATIRLDAFAYLATPSSTWPAVLLLCKLGFEMTLNIFTSQRVFSFG